MSNPSNKTYGQILKSSALIGGSSLVNVVLGIIRTKAMALLLAPGGFGLLGNYVAVSDLVRTVAGMGINVSGVRQIAETAGTGDKRQIARTVTALRRLAFYSGGLGALVLALLCRPVSWLTFKDYDHAGAIALLALVVFFSDVSAGQAALVQGMRRIADLARINVWGALAGTVFSIPIVYFYGENGVVPSLVCVAATGIFTSWWYARKVEVERVEMKWGDIVGEASALLKLGVVFMASGFFTMGAAYAVRVIITWRLGLDQAGYYTAAWTLGGMYIGFIVQAMGTDFYPRLTAVARDNPQCNQLVNEQAEIGLLIAGPGILGTLTFAPLIIAFFYSNRFGPAIGTFQWICLGMLLRVVNWPLGYVIVAKGNRVVFFWMELLANLGHAGLVLAGVYFFKIEGAGLAFFVLNVFHSIALQVIVRRLSGFRWSAANLRVAALFGPLATAAFVGQRCLPLLPAAIFGATATVLCGIYSLRTLCGLVPMDRLPRMAQKMLVFFRLAPVAVAAEQ